jgi:phosphotriesterase-related protein
MPIHTVLGPIEADELGPTSMHEHALIDARVWQDDAAEDVRSAKVTIRSLGRLRWNVMSSADNLVLDEPETALRELTEARRAGLSGLVDLTCVGLGRRPEDLVALARGSDLHIMVGCGFYVHDSHPEWLTNATVDAIATSLIDELDNGIADSGIRPAIIGEIGTSTPITDREARVLRAAGRAGAATGAAVSIHLDARGTEGLNALALATEDGMPPSRVVLGHLDEHLDDAYHLELAATGAVLEYDTFGAEFGWSDGYREPSDGGRMESLARLVEAGHGNHVVLGCDVWAKSQLTTYGGMGYEHLMSRIVPTLRSRYGLPDDILARMLVDTPRRLLER